MAPRKPPAASASKPPAKKTPSRTRATPAKTATAKPKPKPRTPARPAAKKARTRQRTPERQPPAPVPAAEKGTLIGVFGAFGSRALVEVPITVAERLIGEELIDPFPAKIVEAARRDIAAIVKRDKALGESALAASVETLAVEMANPHNSATSKSMCAKALADALKQLRELAPPEQKADRLDEVAKKREHRRRGAGT